MIETERQRRWWFATHPEYSRSGARRGSRPQGTEGDEEFDSMSPEVVDAQIDESLKYERNPVGIALLEEAKFWFGTEFASKTPAEKHALLWDDDDSAGYKNEFGDSWERGRDNSTLGWDTEAGGRIGSRGGQRGRRRTRGGEDIRDWFLLNPAHRRQMDLIERELEIAGIGRRDYRFTFFRDKFVAQRDSTFSPFQRDQTGRTNLERMLDRNAPLDRNGEAVVLHHAGQQNEGPLIEMSRAEHDAMPRRQDSSQIDRSEFRDFRESYWHARALSLLGH